MAALAFAMPADAREGPSVPISDTEDASLESRPVGPGRLHPVLGLDVRNGDFVRGTYDDDGANLGRLPVHVQLGLVYELARDGGGTPNVWLELRSSNGFHAPAARERAQPRAWYESNNLIGIAVRAFPDAIGALTYTVKTSPNGVAPTTHELSGALAWDGDAGLAALHPGLVATWRPKGGGGLYTQAALEPGLAVGGTGGGRLSAPLAIGVGWRGFYGAGSGNRLFGSAGAAYAQPIAIGRAHLSFRAQVLALVRDGRLRRLDGPQASTHAVRPYGTVSLGWAL